VGLVDLLPTALEAFGAPLPGPLDGRSLLGILRGEAGAVREQVIGAHDDLLAEPLRDGRQELDFPAKPPSPRARSIRHGRFKYIRNFETQHEYTNNVLEHSRTWASWRHAAEDEPELRARMDGLRFRPRDELFDLERDPFELENLAGDPLHAGARAQLADELRTWMRNEGDPLAAAWG